MTEPLMKSCPFCGHTPDPDNYIDSLHPTRTGWRDDPLGSGGKLIRHYMRLGDPRGCHGQVWSMSCLENEGGCGVEMSGDSREDVITKWNRRPN